jgi:uncharacterized protein YecE (DUF72 family)
MGFGYEDWLGVFYPPNLPARGYLKHYSRCFNAVELDTTFYGAPRPEQLRRWAQSTPPEFKFCAKLPRLITHEQRLQRAGAALHEFLQSAAALEERLGALLIQLPPDFTPQESQALEAFLGQLPADFRFAVEFRHPAWYAPGTADLLQRHAVCWAATDYQELPRQVVRTADFLYLRWIGEHGRYDRKDHERVDLTARLAWWHAQIQPHLGQAGAVYGFFNNDYAGHSPATCNRFKALAGLPVESLAPPRQERLF